MEYLSIKTWIPYPQKYGDPIHQKTEDNITSINNNKNKEGENENFKKIINFYQNNITLITQFVSEDIINFLEEEKLDAELILEVMKEAVSRNKRNWKYISTVLRNCKNNNITTKQQYLISQEEFKSNKNQNNKVKAKEEHIEYKECEMTEEEYFKKLRGEKNV